MLAETTWPLWFQMLATLYLCVGLIAHITVLVRFTRWDGND